MIQDVVLPANSSTLQQTYSPPLCYNADIPGFSTVAHDLGASVLVDCSWSATWSVKPLTCGADCTVCSSPGLLCDEVQVGLLASTKSFWRRIQLKGRLLGLQPSPDTAYLALRALRTLPARLCQQDASTRKVADFLSNWPQVEAIQHPTCIPGSKSLDERCPPILSFQLCGSDLSSKALETFLDCFHVVRLAGSADAMGGVHSVIWPKRMIEDWQSETSPSMDNATCMVVYIGLEDADDLVDDFRRALLTLTLLPE
mmetsp:Transcript_23467/g.36709  ORF Transcript_23467/g.36709 Transcript_23467/m.36709 type:complete len:256 (-) Transcript_23467:82-849(-)